MINQACSPIFLFLNNEIIQNLVLKLLNIYKDHIFMV